MVKNFVEHYTERILEELYKYGIKPLERDPDSVKSRRAERVHKDVVDYLKWLDEFEDPSRQVPRRVRLSLA